MPTQTPVSKPRQSGTSDRQAVIVTLGSQETALDRLLKPRPNLAAEAMVAGMRQLGR